MNANLRNFALWVIIVLLLLALFTLFQNPGQRTTSQDISFIQQLREGNILRRGALARVLEQGEQREQQENDDHPKGEVAQVGVHPMSFTAVGRSAARSYGNL